MRTRPGLRLALIVAISLCGGSALAAESVILIVVDTLRADHLGSHGFEGGISPHLDALAAESVRFERCFAGAPWTKPSVATLLTSLEPERHGVTNHEGKFWSGDGEQQRSGVLPEAAETLAEAFAAAGYRTAGFVANPWLGRGFGFEQGFQVYDDTGADNTTPADALTPRARSWLDGVGDAPFFLYLHFMDVHGPYDAPERDVSAIAQSPSLGTDRALSSAERDAVPNYLSKSDFAKGRAGRRLRTWRTRYAAGVHAFDRRIGPFLAALRRSGALDRAWLVLTSDHGEQLAEHGGWDHGDDLFDHQLHVPLLIRPPGPALEGRVMPDLIGSIDLMPTLLGVVGIDVPAAASGRDLSGALRGTPFAAPEAVFASASKRHPGLRSARTPRYKLVVDTVSGERALYDLESDPDEQTEVSADAPGPLAALRRHLDAHRARLASAAALDRATAPLSSEAQERLRALGYVE